MSAYWKTLLNSPIPPIPHQVVAAILLISTPIALVWALHMRQNLSVFYSSAVYSVFRPPVRSGYTCVLYTVSQTSVQNNRRFCRMLLSSSWTCTCSDVSSLRPKQNGRHFPDDTFKRIFLNENARISIKISLKFVPKVLIDNNPALVQIMAWRRWGDKPLSEPMTVSLLTHICVTLPQWVQGILQWSAII